MAHANILQKRGLTGKKAKKTARRVAQNRYAAAKDMLARKKILAKRAKAKLAKSESALKMGVPDVIQNVCGYSDPLAIEIENTTYDKKVVNLFSRIKGVPEGVKIINQMMSYTECDSYAFTLLSIVAKPFEFNHVRITCENIYQFEEPIKFIERKYTGTTYESTKHLFKEFDEKQVQYNVVEFYQTGKISVQTDWTFTILPKTKLCIMLDKVWVPNSMPDATKSTSPYQVPVRIENLTDKELNFTSRFSEESFNKINTDGLFKVTAPEYMFRGATAHTITFHGLYSPGLNKSFSAYVYQGHYQKDWLALEDNENFLQKEFNKKAIYPFSKEAEMPLDGKHTFNCKIPANTYIYLLASLNTTKTK